MCQHSRKQDRLVFSNQELLFECRKTDNKHITRMDKFISDTDVGHEEMRCSHVLESLSECGEG